MGNVSYVPEAIMECNKYVDNMMERMEENPIFLLAFPFVSWFAYLTGYGDGNHFWPYGSNNRLYDSSSETEAKKCLLSSAVVFLAFGGILHLYDYSLSAMFQLYLAPLIVFGWWLTCVTYLQHHDHDTVVYDDSNWNYVLAAFETIDRRYGFGIDHLHHHISDGHVAHHLFFTQIPHYNLPIATKAIRKYLTDNNLISVYKYENTMDFAFRFHKYLMQFSYRAKLARNETEVVAPFQKPVHPLETKNQ